MPFMEYNHVIFQILYSDSTDQQDIGTNLFTGNKHIINRIPSNDVICHRLLTGCCIIMRYNTTIRNKKGEIIFSLWA